MKYGTTTSLKYLYPYRKGWCLGQKISPLVEARLKWIEYVQQGNSVLKTSRHFDVPESTIRYWKKRYDHGDLTSLSNRSRKPHNFRTCRLPFSTIDKVIEYRQEFKGWGKEKLQRLLKKEDIKIGQSRIQKIINGAGLKRIPGKRKRVVRKNRRHMYSVPKEVMTRPGGLVYLDVKHLTLAGWGRVYQFSAIDHATRMMRVKIYQRITSLSGKEFLEYLEKSYPFVRIEYLGTDNGSEFLGELEKCLPAKGIKHVFSSPRSPKQNPFIERLIRTTIDEVYYYQGTEVDIETQQKVLDKYMQVYNEVRPHWSLNLQTPLERLNQLNAS